MAVLFVCSTSQRNMTYTQDRGYTRCCSPQLPLAQEVQFMPRSGKQLWVDPEGEKVGSA